MLDATSLLQKLIQIPSTNDQEAVVATLIKTILAEHGIEAKLIEYAPNRSSLIAEIGPKDATTILAFTGHLDVVLPGDLASWQYPPFAGEIHNNRLYGRGAADMKSGIAAMVAAFIALAEQSTPLKGRLRLILTVGEENGAQGAHQLTQLHYVDDLSGLIVGEPTNGKLIYAHKGSFNYTVSSSGKQVHSSTSELGINAIEGLLTFANAEKTLFNDALADPILGELAHAITIINGGEQINNIPAKANLRGNIRPIPTFDNASVADALKKLIAKINATTPYQLTLHIDNSFKPVKTDLASPLVTATKHAIRTVTNTKAVFDIFTGATDASEFTLTTHPFDVIIIGPGSENISHQVNEYVDLNQLETMITLYQQIVYNYFAATN